MAAGTENDTVENCVDGRPAMGAELSEALKTLRDGMLTNSWICPQARTAGGLTSSCSVGVTPDGVARDADVTAVNVKFCRDSELAPWLWMVLLLFAPCVDVQSVAFSKPRICVGSDRALVVAARSSAGAAPSGAQAARPNTREVSAPKSVTIVVFI